MTSLFDTIDREILLSKSRFQDIDSSTSSGASEKLALFSAELQRLNLVFYELINSYMRENNLSEPQVKEVKDYVSVAMTDFITHSGVPGVNPNFKLNID